MPGGVRSGKQEQKTNKQIKTNESYL